MSYISYLTRIPTEPTPQLTICLSWLRTYQVASLYPIVSLSLTIGANSFFWVLRLLPDLGQWKVDNIEPIWCWVDYCQTLSLLQREISLPLIVYRPIRFTHNAFHGILRTTLVGNVHNKSCWECTITCIERLLFGKIYTACSCWTDVTHHSPTHCLCWYRFSWPISMCIIVQLVFLLHLEVRSVCYSLWRWPLCDTLCLYYSQGCVAQDDYILDIWRGDALIFVRGEAPIFVGDTDY
jgi:hypothetical protein